MEFDDLFQCGYIALIEAVDTYRIDGGASFLTWLNLYIKKEFTQEIGCKTQRQKEEPLFHSVSLDAPVSSTSEELTIGEMIADTRDQFEDIEQSIYRTQIGTVVREALNILPEREYNTLSLRFYGEQTLFEISKALGCSIESARKLERKGLEYLRNCDITPALRECYYQDQNLYRGTSLASWKESGCSVQESVLIRSENERHTSRTPPHPEIFETLREPRMGP